MIFNNEFFNLAYVYALGYYDGRALGVGQFHRYADEERSAYKAGYDRGVADYCATEAEEDV